MASMHCSRAVAHTQDEACADLRGWSVVTENRNIARAEARGSGSHGLDCRYIAVEHGRTVVVIGGVLWTKRLKLE